MNIWTPLKPRAVPAPCHVRVCFFNFPALPRAPSTHASAAPRGGGLRAVRPRLPEATPRIPAPSLAVAAITHTHAHTHTKALVSCEPKARRADASPVPTPAGPSRPFLLLIVFLC
jgi:hypothetical protein